MQKVPSRVLIGMTVALTALVALAVGSVSVAAPSSATAGDNDSAAASKKVATQARGARGPRGVAARAAFAASMVHRALKGRGDSRVPPVPAAARPGSA